MRELQHGREAWWVALVFCIVLAARASPPAPLIVAFGDSLTAPPGVAPTQSYPADLQRLLSRNGYTGRVLNLGVAGDTSADGLARVGPVLRLHPAWVILELGGNDGLRGLPVTVTKTNLAAIIVQLQAAHIHVLLVGITLPPNYGPQYIHAFQAIYPALARACHLPLLPSLYQDLIPRLPRTPGLLQADGIHPTAAGAAVIAGTVARALRPLLERTQP